MNEWTQILLIGIIVFITHALEGITGFGCTVLALPFVAMLLGIKTTVPVLAVLAWLLAGYIVIISWKQIVWKEYFFIVLYVGLGLPFGMLLFRYLPEEGLKGLLSLLMIGVGINGILKTRKRSLPELSILETQTNLQTTTNKNTFMRTILFMGGVIHGAFVSGGPFVVIYASKALPDKSLFRVSLCLLWFTLNTVWIIQFTLFDQLSWTPEMGRTLLTTLPFLAVGILTGNYLHRLVNEYYFRLIVYATLFVSGLILLFSVLKIYSLITL
ncbi:MAG: sulfite exporter TauE/SafE family protein [Planctomycetaceae bacterium]|jgi:uncharacterized membrane protein YfcA|nr:sulfite exporter TauE/SafE family protein [Planctomycetaceae bacterium]